MIKVILTAILCFIITNNGVEDTSAAKANKRGNLMKNIEIIVTFDNYPYKKGLTTEWGFSCLVKASDSTDSTIDILFDTGANGQILLDNMQKLNINAQDIDKVFLSHRHWDHIGGLSRFLDVNHNVEVYCLKSFPKEIKRTITKSGAKLVEIEKSQEIYTDFFTTGSMGTSITEQSLAIKTDKGFILITGCAHPGILNIVKKAAEITKIEPLLVMGGFHLLGCDNRELLLIADKLQEMKVQYVAPSHCSGTECRALFRQRWADKYIELGLGQKITFPLK
ncbi:MAG: MBL fold metallo-hydrolase [Candidatus Cloacimonadota bacterium]|nr:MAG: MBL fold metallo-hydrolase [Candidatus Cloacimonadota bacterium]